jgi:transcriptional regulator with XRE-family HTH domain
MSVIAHRFHENLKVLRVVKGKTQAQVCQALSIPHKTYAAYEERRGKPDYNRLIVMAEYFNVSIDDLLKKEMTCTTE